MLLVLITVKVLFFNTSFNIPVPKLFPCIFLTRILLLSLLFTQFAYMTHIHLTLKDIYIYMK